MKNTIVVITLAVITTGLMILVGSEVTSFVQGIFNPISDALQITGE